MKNWLIVGLVAAITVGVTSCGGSQDLSLEEYVDLVCGGYDLDVGGNDWPGLPISTVSDFVEKALEYRDVIPPPQYARWHAEGSAWIALLRDWLSDQDEDDTFSWNSLLRDGFWVTFLSAASVVEESEIALSDEDAQILIDAGCDIEREGE